MHMFVTACVDKLLNVLLLLAVTVSVSANELYIESDDNEGRKIWMNNCEGCHGYGIADAPVPMIPDDWVFRIAKGKSTLYSHAINGYIGPDYSMMPARGGNEELSDEEVKRAVDYMVFLASFYINEVNSKKRGE